MFCMWCVLYLRCYWLCVLFFFFKQKTAYDMRIGDWSSDLCSSDLEYLEYCADQRMAQLGMPKHFNARNPFPFMELQDVQELANFFERRVSAYQVGVQGEVGFDHAF